MQKKQIGGIIKGASKLLGKAISSKAVSSTAKKVGSKSVSSISKKMASKPIGKPKSEWMRGLGKGTTKGQLESAYNKGKAVGAIKGATIGSATVAGAAAAGHAVNKKKSVSSSKPK